MGCARHCEKTALLAGCLYAVGARKGMRECEERMMVSPAFMRSIAARDGVWALVKCRLVGSSEVGRRANGVCWCWLAAHSPAFTFTHLRTFCACLSGVRCLRCCFVRGFTAKCHRMTRALLDSPRARSNFHEPPNACHCHCRRLSFRSERLQPTPNTAPWHTTTVHLPELTVGASLTMAHLEWRLPAWTRRLLLLLKRSSTSLESTSMHP